MKLFAKKEIKTDTEKAYEDAMTYLQTLPRGTDRYNEQLDICERLQAMVMTEKAEKNNGHRVSPDTIATCACSVAGVLICAYRDYWHPIATKGLNFVLKARGR